MENTIKAFNRSLEFIRRDHQHPLNPERTFLFHFLCGLVASEEITDEMYRSLVDQFESMNTATEAHKAEKTKGYLSVTADMDS